MFSSEQNFKGKLLCKYTQTSSFSTGPFLLMESNSSENALNIDPSGQVWTLAWKCSSSRRPYSFFVCDLRPLQDGMSSLSEAEYLQTVHKFHFCNLVGVFLRAQQAHTGHMSHGTISPLTALASSRLVPSCTETILVSYVSHRVLWTCLSLAYFLLP